MESRSTDNHKLSKLKSNKLVEETSPYLLQHAYNPVNWYPWSKESILKAQTEDKPIFLSIGYSACHWCHVMAHESFEDMAIAKIMNENFVNIKVDREERPDIDDIYQRVCQLVTGTGGWPLSVFLTPDQKPFYVGTYFPKHARYGTPGFGTILTQLADAYNNKRKEIDSATVEFLHALENSSRDVIQSTGVTFDRSTLDEAGIGLLQIGDPVYGGFGHAPKFPNPSNLLFLLRCYDISGINKYKDFVILTADRMAAGGIYDHIGGGFARYSTDQKWLVPHFEKMLYDNALLVQVYSELHQITRDEKYLHVLTKTLDYVLREMMSPDYGFYSAQDADSEGEEGKYYVWSKQEIVDSLSNEMISNIICEYYGISQFGNFEGKNILNVRASIGELSRKYGQKPETIKQAISEATTKLFEIRAQRVKPGLDDKILTAWNGLMISGFAKGYRVTDNRRYLEIAENAVEFIQTRLSNSEGRLFRTFKNGEYKLNGYLDDYAFYVNALLDIFELSPNHLYLERAIKHTDFMLEHFWDIAERNLFFTSDDHEKLIVRTKSLYDLALPSGNSVAASNLLRLHVLTQNPNYLEKAEQVLESGSKASIQNPFGFGQLLIAIYMYVKKPIEITIRAENRTSEGKNMVDWLNKQFIPNAVIIFVENNSQLSSLQKYSYFKETDSTGTKQDFAVICKNSACSLPLYSLSQMQQKLKSLL